MKKWFKILTLCTSFSAVAILGYAMFILNFDSGICLVENSFIIRNLEVLMSIIALIGISKLLLKEAK